MEAENKWWSGWILIISIVVPLVITLRGIRIPFYRKVHWDFEKLNMALSSEIPARFQKCVYVKRFFFLPHTEGRNIFSHVNLFPIYSPFLVDMRVTWMVAFFFFWSHKNSMPTQHWLNSIKWQQVRRKDGCNIQLSVTNVLRVTVFHLDNTVAFLKWHLLPH